MYRNHFLIRTKCLHHRLLLSIVLRYQLALTILPKMVMHTNPAKHPRLALPATALGRLILYLRLTTVPTTPPRTIPPIDHLSVKFCPSLASNLQLRSCHSIKLLFRITNVVAITPTTGAINMLLADELTKDLTNDCWRMAYFVGSDGGRSLR